MTIFSIPRMVIVGCTLDLHQALMAAGGALFPVLPIYNLGQNLCLHCTDSIDAQATLREVDGPTYGYVARK